MIHESRVTVMRVIAFRHRRTTALLLRAFYIDLISTALSYQRFRGRASSKTSLITRHVCRWLYGACSRVSCPFSVLTLLFGETGRAFGHYRRLLGCNGCNCTNGNGLNWCGTSRSTNSNFSRRYKVKSKLLPPLNRGL